MDDLYLAIAQHSMLLSLRVGRLASRRGWACRSVVFRPAQGSTEALVDLTTTLVHLPLGSFATFAPQDRPLPLDAASVPSWRIEIHRSNGVLKEAWSQGLTLSPKGAGHALHFAGVPVEESALDEILSSLALPEPSGMVRTIHKVWVLRFGDMPGELLARLEKVDHIDHLDLIYHQVLWETPEAIEKAIDHKGPYPVRRP